jgi:hypothetical protein
MDIDKPYAWFRGSEASSPFNDLKKLGLVKYIPENPGKTYFVVPKKKLLEQLSGKRAPDFIKDGIDTTKVSALQGSTRPNRSYGRILMSALGILGPF